MKKLFILISISLFSLLIAGCEKEDSLGSLSLVTKIPHQVTSSTSTCNFFDDFNDNTPPTTYLSSSSGCVTFSESGGELRCQYFGNSYTESTIIDIYDGGGYKLLDVTANPKLHMRVRMDFPGRIMVLLKDTNNFYTTIDTTQLVRNVGTAQVELSFNFAGLFQDNGNFTLHGSSCSSGCPVNPQAIRTILIYMYDQTNASIFIDELKIGGVNCLPSGASIQATKLRGSMVGFGRPDVEEHGFTIQKISPAPLFNETVYLGPRKEFGDFSHEKILPTGTYTINTFAERKGLDSAITGSPITYSVP